jgi:hypothetical protein
VIFLFTMNISWTFDRFLPMIWVEGSSNTGFLFSARLWKIASAMRRVGFCACVSGTAGMSQITARSSNTSSVRWARTWNPHFQRSPQDFANGFQGGYEHVIATCTGSWANFAHYTYDGLAHGILIPKAIRKRSYFVSCSGIECIAW